MSLRRPSPVRCFWHGRLGLGRQCVLQPHCRAGCGSAGLTATCLPHVPGPALGSGSRAASGSPIRARWARASTGPQICPGVLPCSLLPLQPFSTWRSQYWTLTLPYISCWQQGFKMDLREVTLPWEGVTRRKLSEAAGTGTGHGSGKKERPCPVASSKAVP